MCLLCVRNRVVRRKRQKDGERRREVKGKGELKLKDCQTAASEDDNVATEILPL